MADAPSKPRRRWFAFSLRTLFVMVTMFACWLGWAINLARERQAMLSRVRVSSFARLEGESSMACLEEGPGEQIELQQGDLGKFFDGRRLVGGHPCECIFLSHGAFSEREERTICRLFPEARIEVYTGNASVWNPDAPVAPAAPP